MFFRKRSKANSSVNGLKTLSGLILLLFYVSGNVQVESFHQLFHASEAELHTSEHEKDPCHRAIYHDSQDDGCDHKTHLTAVKKCPLCHVVPHNEQHFAVSHDFQSFSLPTIFNDVISCHPLGENFFTLSVRGPPVA